MRPFTNMRGISLIACTIVAVAMAPPGTAEEAVGAKKIDVAPQQLSSALQDFSEQSGLQVAYVATLAHNVDSKGTHDARTAESALSEILDSTGLEYQFVNADTVAIGPAFAANNEAADPGNARRMPRPVVMAQASEMKKVQATDPSSQANAIDRSQGRDLAIEEIIVTAQKREENLRDVPVSISVLSGDYLDQSSLRSVAAVLNQVGGVSVTELYPGRTEIVIRGIIPGNAAPTTGYYLDEVPFGFVRFSDLPYSNSFDLERVEVLRGPQGTLYGTNALSGVVRVLTNEANLDAFEVKGRLRASSTADSGAGNYGGDLAINAPLIPGKLALRGVVGYSDDSGFIDSSLDGQSRINDTQAQSYRVKLNYQLIEDLSVKLGYARSEIDNGANSMSLADYTTPFSSNRPDERVLDMYNLVVEYEWPSVSLLSSTGYVDYSTETMVELVLFSFLEIQTLESFSQEVRLTSRLDGPWQWLLGAFYRDAEHVSAFDIRPVFPSVSQQTERSESYAVFGEATRSFGDGRYEVTGGLRYYRDHVETSEQGNFFGLPLFPGDSTDFDGLTGRFVFSYKPNEDVMLYGSVASGYRSGQHQTPTIRRIEPGFPAVEPDTLITYEVGAKGLLLNGSISYETTVYYTDWDDIQQSLIIPEGFTARVNASGASGVGVDANIVYKPTGALTLQASFGWNDLTFDEDVLSAGAVLFTKGSRPNDAPEWTGSIAGSYRTPTPIANVDFVLSSNFAFGSERERRFLSAGEIDQTRSDDMRRWDATIGVEGDRWSVALFGENLLNEDAAITPPVDPLTATAVHLRPRTVGLQVTFDY